MLGQVQLYTAVISATQEVEVGESWAKLARDSIRKIKLKVKELGA
jgi:hypothetical protein